MHVAQGVGRKVVEAPAYRLVLKPDLLVARRGLGDRTQHRPVAPVDVDGFLEGATAPIGVVVGTGLPIPGLRRRQLPPRPHGSRAADEVAEVVEVAVEEGAADASLAHHGVDAPLRIRARADEPVAASTMRRRLSCPGLASPSLHHPRAPSYRS